MFIISLYCKIMEKQKNTRNIRTLEEKYKIIKYYESIEHTGRDSKKKTVDKFNNLYDMMYDKFKTYNSKYYS